MFNDSINFVAQSIEKSPLLEKNGCYYQKFMNFFPEDLLDELVNVDETYKLEKVETQEHRNRVRLSYSEIISKKINLIFRSTKIKSVLEQIYKIKLKPSSVDIWLDSGDYYMTPHTDDVRVKLAIQIYLGNDNVGTSLFPSVDSRQPVETFDYKLNNGYALLNNKKSIHGPTTKVLHKKELRKSVYIRYGN